MHGCKAPLASNLGGLWPNTHRHDPSCLEDDYLQHYVADDFTSAALTFAGGYRCR